MLTLFTASGDNGDNGYITFFVKKTPIKVLFQSIPDSLTDARDASYSEMPIAKRTEPLLIYQNTGFRKVSFGLQFAVLDGNAQDAYDMFAISSLIRRSVLPSKRGVPMYCKLNLGPWFINWALSSSGSGYTLIQDGYSEKPEGMTAIIRDWSLTPSKERYTDTNLRDKFPLPQNWWKKAPKSIAVALTVTVFAQQVWSAGQFNMPSLKNLENDENATTLPELSKAANSSTNANETPEATPAPPSHPPGYWGDQDYSGVVSVKSSSTDSDSL